MVMLVPVAVTLHRLTKKAKRASPAAATTQTRRRANACLLCAIVLCALRSSLRATHYCRRVRRV
jgi:hypothetical protein